MPQDGEQPAFSGPPRFDNETVRSSLQHSRPMIEGQASFGWADRVVAVLALLDEDRPDLLFEELASGRGEVVIPPQRSPGLRVPEHAHQGWIPPPPQVPPPFLMFQRRTTPSRPRTTPFRPHALSG